MIPPGASPQSAADAFSPRVLDDLDAQTTPSLEQAMQEIGAVSMDAGGPPPDEAVIAAEYEAKVTEQRALEPQLRAFEAFVIHHYLAMLRAASTTREMSFEDGGVEMAKRVDRINARASNRNRITFNEDGSVVTEYKDGHRVAGLMLGWCCQNIQSGTAQMNNLQFGRPRFYSANMQGKRQENKKTAQAIEATFDLILREADFRRQGRLRNAAVFKCGNAFLKWEWVKKLEFAKNPETGAYEEKPGKLKLCITPRPFEDVVPVNMALPNLRDHEGVFDCYWSTNYSQLVANEAVMEMGPDGVERRVQGEFFNLDALRQADARESLVAEYSNKFSLMAEVDTTSLRLDQLSFFAQFHLIRWQGACPIMALQAIGALTPAVAKFFKVDVGIDPMVDFDGWCRRAARIKTWKISFVFDATSAKAYPESYAPGMRILQFEPCPYRDQEFDLAAYKYAELPDRFIADGIVDLGYQIEAAAEGIVNFLYREVGRSANPSGTVDLNALVTQTEEEARRILGFNQMVAVQGGKLGADIFKTFENRLHPNAMQLVPMLQSAFDAATGILPASKGTDSPATGTLGEMEIDLQKSDDRFENAFSGIVNEDYRMMVLMLRRYREIEGEQGLIDLMIRATGLESNVIADMIPSIDDFLNEFTLELPGTFGADGPTLSQAILAAAPVWGMVSDPATSYKTYLEGYGMMNPEDIMTASVEQPAAEDIINSLSLGEYVKPNAFTDPFTRERNLMEMNAMMALVKSGQPVIVKGAQLAPERVAMLAQVLPGYLVMEQAFYDQQMAQMQQMQAAQPGKAPGKAGAGGSERAGGTNRAQQAAAEGGNGMEAGGEAPVQ